MSFKKVTLPNSSETTNDKLSFERLVFFSDAVFAIAITLLALEVQLPKGYENLSDLGLQKALISIWPKYLGYIISFLVIGLFWMGHHRKLQFIQRYDRKFIFLNLLLLMVIAFIPFPASILSEYGNRSATIFYAVIMIIAGLLSSLNWFYAVKNYKLIDPALDNSQRNKELWGPVLMAGVFLLSIGISFINADLAKISWVFILFSTRLTG